MKVILLERVGRIRSHRRRSHRQGRLRPQLPAAAGQGAPRHRSQPRKFERDRADIEKRNQERREAAAGIAAGLNGQTVVIIRQAGETGQLYGSVASRDVAEALSADGFTVARSQVDLADPIKTVGVHTRAAAPARRSRCHDQRSTSPARKTKPSASPRVKTSPRSTTTTKPPRNSPPARPKSARRRLRRRRVSIHSIEHA